MSESGEPGIGPEGRRAGAALGRYRLLLRLSKAALFWERLWPSLWPVFGVAALFAAAALADVLPALGAWLHAAALVLFAGALGFAVRGAWGAARKVDAGEARHRLERNSGLKHRPLTALGDRLFGAGGAATLALWREHLRRMAESVKSLRVGAPSPGVARRDRWGLRSAALLALVVGLFVGGDQAGRRLERAFLPDWRSGGAAGFAVEIWITPPAYTGMAPRMLGERRPQAGAGERVPVPAGSAVLAQAGGEGKAPSLRVGGRTLPFEEVGPRGFRAEAVVDEADDEGEDSRLAVERGGRALAAWPIQVIPDRPPTVAFVLPPARTGQARLRIEFEAGDDYGLTDVSVHFRHPEGYPVPGGGADLRLALPLPQPGVQRTKGASVHDLSPHPWAGVAVEAQLVARDARGQTGKSEALTIVLPERIFNHPVARAVVAERKKLAAPSPDAIASAAAGLDAIAERPQHFYDDTVVYLALRIARERLTRDGSASAVASVQKLLWDTALRIEDGEFSIAERELRQIQERLMEALRDGRPEMKEVERLMDELRQALDKFLQALREQMEREGLTEVPLDPNMRLVEGSDLQRMIEEARELLRMGAVDAARRLLAELQRMLESLQGGMQAGKQAMKEMGRAMKLMEGLRGLTQRQQRLLDRTFKEAQEGRDGRGRPGERASPGAGEQEELRRRLGELMLELDELMGGIPPGLGQAERSMRDAAESLQQGRPGAAVPSQTDALEQLRKAQEGLSQQMAQRFGMMPGLVGQRPFDPRRQGRDPFGRTEGGAFGASIDGPVKVPDEMEMRRAREILDELRRRAGESARPRIERNYIERLLRQF
jgi:uncharacterized protein (TIGR02302 family)